MTKRGRMWALIGMGVLAITLAPVFILGSRGSSGTRQVGASMLEFIPSAVLGWLLIPVGLFFIAAATRELIKGKNRKDR